MMVLVATFFGGWKANEFKRRWQSRPRQANSPSLSNTAFLIEALRAADAKEDSDDQHTQAEKR